MGTINSVALVTQMAYEATMVCFPIFLFIIFYGYVLLVDLSSFSVPITLLNLGAMKRV